MVDPYYWEAYSLFQGMTARGWQVERPYVRKYLSGWPKWSAQRKCLAKQGVRRAAEYNAKKGVPGWRLPSATTFT